MGINMGKEKERAAAKSQARMAKNLGDRERAYGPLLTSDGLPKTVPTRVSEVNPRKNKGAKHKSRTKRKRRESEPRFIVVGFKEYDAHPRFEGGIRWEQGGLPGSGKRR